MNLIIKQFIAIIQSKLNMNEKPFDEKILEQANRKIGTNIVFTIEPSFDTVFGKMRIEDIIAITSTGKVINLTK